ncbi:hypothetical protein NQ317_010419, partial [Molorchus minor]
VVALARRKERLDQLAKKREGKERQAVPNKNRCIQRGRYSQRLQMDQRKLRSRFTSSLTMLALVDVQAFQMVTLTYGEISSTLTF